MSAHAERRVTILVEFMINESDSEGDALSRAVEPVRALPAAEIRTVTVENERFPGSLRLPRK